MDTRWVYVVSDAERAGKALVTVLVDDVVNAVAELGQRGLTTGVIETVPGLYSKAILTDPEGNSLSLGQKLSADS